jgi:hypothetical protein
MIPHNFDEAEAHKQYDDALKRRDTWPGEKILSARLSTLPRKEDTSFLTSVLPPLLTSRST